MAMQDGKVSAGCGWSRQSLHQCLLFGVDTAVGIFLQLRRRFAPRGFLTRCQERLKRKRVGRIISIHSFLCSGYCHRSRKYAVYMLWCAEGQHLHVSWLLVQPAYCRLAPLAYWRLAPPAYWQLAPLAYWRLAPLACWRPAPLAHWWLTRLASWRLAPSSWPRVFLHELVVESSPPRVCGGVLCATSL